MKLEPNSGVIIKHLERRTECYVMRPRKYEISGCPFCGNEDPEWSEFKGHLWCASCGVDFDPESDGIFDGPIPVQSCFLMGIDLRMFNIETGEISVDPREPDFKPKF